MVRIKATVSRLPQVTIRQRIRRIRTITFKIKQILPQSKMGLCHKNGQVVRECT